MSLNTFYFNLINSLRTVERTFLSLIYGTQHSFNDYYRLDLALLPGNTNTNTNNNGNYQKSLLEEIIGDGFLYGVPKSRRSIEKRLKRKYGHSEYGWKILLPRKNLLTCKVCGDDHEHDVMCPTCYKRIITETTEMQDKIQENLQLEPVENEVVVLYEGEKDKKPLEHWKGKRIVEMSKPRPAWFTENLLQRTTQTKSESSDVKPSELG